MKKLSVISSLICILLVTQTIFLGILKMGLFSIRNISTRRFGITLALICTLVVCYFCSSPQNPFEDPENVTIDLLFPDTINSTVYTLDTTTITMVTTLTSLVDSVKLSIGAASDSLFTSIFDTMPVSIVFQDSGRISIVAQAYCENGIIKECQKELRVHKNPLMPPDTVYTQPLSDTSISLYWKNVRVARKYRVYRSLSVAGTFSVIKTVEDTLYLDDGLTDSTTYYYRISSIDSLNRESDRSSIFSAMTFALSVSRWDQMVWDVGSWE
jgi:hypothetical protein